MGSPLGPAHPTSPREDGFFPSTPAAISGTQSGPQGPLQRLGAGAGPGQEALGWLLEGTGCKLSFPYGEGKEGT